MAMMGQNIGAGKVKRVRDAFKTAALLGVGSATLISVLAFFLAEKIVGAFTQDPIVTAYAVKYFHIVPLGYAFFSLAFIEANVFQGLGRSWPGFWITLARVGLAFGLTLLAVKVFAMPIQAVWASLAVSSVAVSLIGFAWLWQAMKSIKPKETGSDASAGAEVAISIAN
jgi:Na+-driven multidrug efflux pump